MRNGRLLTGSGIAGEFGVSPSDIERPDRVGGRPMAGDRRLVGELPDGSGDERRDGIGKCRARAERVADQTLEASRAVTNEDHARTLAMPFEHGGWMLDRRHLDLAAAFVQRR